jgi:tetratricopeptide (TPR) repeat protein
MKNTHTINPYFRYGLPILGGIVLIGIRLFVYSDFIFENNATVLLESFQYKEDGFLGNPIFDATGFMQVLPNVFNILIKNIGLMLFPITLVHDYGFSHSTLVGWTNPWVIVSIIIHLGLIYVIIREFKKKSELLFGVLFYFITLSVFLHIIQVGPDYMAERFLFIPSLGFIIAVVSIIERITDASFNIDANPIWKNNKARIALGVVGLFFVLGFVKTTDRNKAWENNKVLFESDIDALDDCARAQYNYACLLHSEYYKQPTQLKQEKILYHYGRAVDISSRSMKAMLDLGNAYMEFGQIEKGKETFLNAVKAHDGLVAPLLQLGNYYFSQNQFIKALIQYEKAEELAKLPNIFHSKAICHLKLDQTDNAILALEEGVKYEPSTSDYFVLMSDLYLAKQDKIRAKEAIQKAIDLAPEDKAIREKSILLNEKFN